MFELAGAGLAEDPARAALLATATALRLEGHISRQQFLLMTGEEAPVKKNRGRQAMANALRDLAREEHFRAQLKERRKGEVEEEARDKKEKKDKKEREARRGKKEALREGAKRKKRKAPKGTTL